MSPRRITSLGMTVLLLLLCATTSVIPSLAQGAANRAAVIVHLASGQVIVRVVPFDGASVTGLELLQASGLPLVSWSNLVCKIGSQGCSNPSTNDECFCQCTAQSGKCEFWRYFHWQEGQWKFSGAGAGEYAVLPEGIDGWAWGDNAARPMEITPAAIWDARRLAPGLVQATATNGTLGLRVDVQGDENHNSSAVARFRSAGGAWNGDPISLARQNDTYNGAWSTPLQPGAYEVSVAFSDADGINGSATITETVQASGSQRLWLPMLLSFGTSN